jgi:hypothetical protein
MLTVLGQPAALTGLHSPEADPQIIRKAATSSPSRC